MEQKELSKIKAMKDFFEERISFIKSAMKAHIDIPADSRRNWQIKEMLDMLELFEISVGNCEYIISQPNKNHKEFLNVPYSILGEMINTEQRSIETVKNSNVADRDKLLIFHYSAIEKFESMVL